MLILAIHDENYIIKDDVGSRLRDSYVYIHIIIYNYIVWVKVA